MTFRILTVCTGNIDKITPPTTAGMTAAIGGMRRPPRNGTQPGTTSPHWHTRPTPRTAASSDNTLRPNTCGNLIHAVAGMSIPPAVHVGITAALASVLR